MKIRSGFVSNSSSSSFVVIGKQKLVFPKIISSSLDIPEDFGGNYQFGWENEEYDTFADRLNWAALCAIYKREADSDLSWLNMLIDVLREDLHLDTISINFNIDHYDEENENSVFGYIDHQSTPQENPENGAMFADKESLKKFLYAEDSVIIGGNDNE
jgi:hypothetical protein